MVKNKLPQSLNKYIFMAALLLLMLVPLQPVMAQTSLAACTAGITDTDGDSINDNDGAGGRIDIDKDGDGLIEICDIEGINEMRYQLDGSGYKANENATKITQGCPLSLGCIGYELVGSLDFNSATDYRNGSINTDWTVADYASATDIGWQPLPGFGAIFNGNGHIISNLQINRVGENNVGLFAVLQLTGRVENVELVYPNVRGGSNVGGLVGNNNGVVINSYVRDYDTDSSTRDTSKYIEAIGGSVGGLVGRNNGGGANLGYIINSGAVIDVQIKQNTSTDGIGANAGGLTGFNLNGAEIRNSYARGTVKGPCGVGGLTANNFSTRPLDPDKNSKIINSYATGNVTTGFGKCNDDGNVRSGGLTAINNGLILNSYTTSCWASGTATVASNRRGGVVQNNSGTINNSYYQTTDCDGLQQTPSGSNKPQSELQTATITSTQTNIYQEWSPNEWDFGSNSQYPAIRYTRGTDKDNPGCGHRGLPDCDDLIKNQLPAGRSATDPASSAVSIGDIVTSITPVDDIDSSVLQPPEFNLLNSQYKLYVTDTRTDPTDLNNSMEIDLLLASGYSFSECDTNITSLANGSGNISCAATKATVNFNRHHTITFNVKRTSPDTTYGQFSMEVIPVAISQQFTSNNILKEMTAVNNIGSFAFEPPAFDTNITSHQLHVQDTRTSADQQMHIRLMFSSAYNFERNTCRTNINSLPDGQGSVHCPVIHILNPNNVDVVFEFFREFNSRFNREHTISFILFNNNKEYSIHIIPDLLFSSVIMNSEVNGEPVIFSDDEEVTHVNEGDIVNMNIVDGFVLQEGVSQPLDYYWYSRSGRPTLFSGELRGESISFAIDSTLFSDNESGDAVLVLEARNKYNPSSILASKEIPMRILGRLSIASDVETVMRDQVVTTLHRVVLASDQPQTVITAHSLNEAITFTVDDSDAKVSAANGSGASTSSIITVQVDEGGKTEFTITVVSGDTRMVHRVQVFRRSAVILAGLQLADVTVDAALSAPGIYSGFLSEGTTNVTITQIGLTTVATNASAIPTITVDEDGSGSNPPVAVITPNTDFYPPATVANITTNPFNLQVGSVIAITLRMRDEYVAETRASPTLDDLPDREGVYTIEIVSRPATILDDDLNSLIDIDTIEDLDEIRNYYINMPKGCGILAIQQCRGFELKRNLDFNTAESYQDNTVDTTWTTSDGWLPIGSSAHLFSTTFEGNGFTIANLHINREENNIGLFSVLGSNGVVKNVGLLDVSIVGSDDIGSLVGRNHGSIINSYVTTATIVGNDTVGGLIGENYGSVISSFADGEVSGLSNVGGLVGENRGHIANTYATGTVSQTSMAEVVHPLGGLVGANLGSITNSYAISNVMAGSDDALVDGLVGLMHPNTTMTASYWDKTVNASLMESVNARTTAELQLPTAPGNSATDTYYGWHSRDWDFGESVDYPTLRYAGGTEMNACASDTLTSSVLPSCGSLLPNQNIRYLSSAFGVSEIIMNAQPTANSDGIIDEGSLLRLMVDVVDDRQYRYQWSQISDSPLELTNTTTATLEVTIPANFVATQATTTEVIFKVVVDDGSATISRSKRVTIRKINNGSASIAVAINPAWLRVITQPDADGEGFFSYQWQQLEFGARWNNIAAATTTTYWLPADANENIRYRVVIQHTDGQGYMTSYQQGPFRVSVDNDADGLIDIYYLEDIDAIRYQLDGSGYRISMDATINTDGCPQRVCNGYELRKDLDFNVAADYASTSNKVIWTTGLGWQPIGSSGNPFRGVFEGNGHTISNLQINRASNDVGLYSVLHATGVIKNVGLLDVAINGLDAFFNIGSLVGDSRGSIINSYATGNVSANSNNVGGLVGLASTVMNSYAMVDVSGDNNVGGLVGLASTVMNSYATGDVNGDNKVGGLVGSIREVINSYATGNVRGNTDVGGLVGFRQSGGPATTSYWDTQKSGQSQSLSGIGKTTAELQSPTAATGIYSDWSNSSWDFGGSEDYPVLRYIKGGNLNACIDDAADITISSPFACATLLPGQSERPNNKGLLKVFFLDDGAATAVELSPSFSQFTYHYDMTIVASGLDIQLRPYAANESAKIAITQSSTDYFSGNRANGALSDAISLEANETTITIVVTDTIDSVAINTTYTYVVVRLLPIRVDFSRSQLNFIMTPATPDPDGAGAFSYQWQQQVPGLGWINIAGATTPTYWLPDDVDGSIRYRLVNIKHTDGGGNITHYPNQGPFRISIDDDGDGLIDIYTLEDLDAMRYQLDGRGYRRNKEATLITKDCPQQVCSGYELRRDLDFNVNTSYHTTFNKVIWTTDTGWDPIGHTSNPFRTLFEGNGHTISSVYIKQEATAGLFFSLSGNGEIKNVGLLDVDITGTRVGGLVSFNSGKIINSYVMSGKVTIIRDDNPFTGHGGLVGRNEGQIISSFVNVIVLSESFNIGGLVGENSGLIINSYALGDVSGFSAVGGLVGYHQAGSIISSSYATGNIKAIGNESGGLVGSSEGSIKNTYATGAVSSNQYSGGLVGTNWRQIMNSYATGSATGNNFIGGLIGLLADGSVTASYWDVTDNIQISGSGSSKTTVELKSPTAAGSTPTEIYYGWRDADWNFGHSEHYPALNYVSGNNNACRSKTDLSSLLPICGSLISQQRLGLDSMLLFIDDEEMTEILTPSFSPFIYRYETSFTTATAVRLALKPLASNANATIKITEHGDSTRDYFAGKENDALSDVIALSHSVTLAITVTDILYGNVTTDTIYTWAITIPFGVAEFAINLDEVVNADGSIDEGSTATLKLDVRGGSGDYQYIYKIVADGDETLLSQMPPPVELKVPADFIASASTMQTVELNIFVSDDDSNTFEYNEEITIRKVNNGSAKVDIIRETTRTLITEIGSDPDGDAAVSNSMYQWQSRAPSAAAQWTDIVTAMADSYTISDDLAITGTAFRVKVVYTDGQGYRNEVYSNIIEYILLPACTSAIEDRDDDDVDAAVDIDKDGDGLIELCDLEGINEIRYQLDGHGYKASAQAISVMRGCPLVDEVEQCNGYELVNNLDFNDANSYRANTTSSKWLAGSGWLPIATDFSSVFEGNGYSISGLYINRTEDAAGTEQGLFSELATNASISNIQLLNVNVQGRSAVGALVSRNLGVISHTSVSGTVAADSDVGGLVGINEGQIISSFADVMVTARINGGGGLVGHNQGSVSASYSDAQVMSGASLGGLSGLNDGSIISSYATGTIAGSDNSGGLVGLHNGLIMNSYATAAVTASGDNSGGLVGLNNRLGRIVNTYAEGQVMGASQVGGLVGRHHGSIMNSYAALGAVSGSGNNIGGLIGMMRSTATIIASYWDSETSGQLISAGGRAQMTAELQNQITPGSAPTEVYYGWHSRNWDFGDSSHYPALRYAANDDLNDCAIDITPSSTALPCTLLLPNQRSRNKGLATVFFFADGLPTTMTSTPLFTPLTDSYDMTVVIASTHTQLTLRPYAINDNATITVTDQNNESYFTEKSNGELSDEIRLDDEITLSIVIAEIIAGTAINTTYTFTIARARSPLVISDLSISPSATIDEGSDVTIRYTVSGGSGVYEYAHKIDDGEFIQSQPSLVYSAPSNLVAADADTQTVRITIRVSDQDDLVETLFHPQEITVRKIDNGSNFSIRSEVDQSQLRIISEGSDADGDGSFSYQWQQRGLAGVWMDITDATTASYQVPPDADGSIRYQVNIEHTDGQGYISNYQQGPLRGSMIDDNNNGLIDIYYLEDLNAMRYQLDGSGYRMDMNAPINSQGCPQTGCRGYELRRSLDFTTNTSYILPVANKDAWTNLSGSGWMPLGTNTDRFRGVFEGNGHTISNLYIASAGARQALFYALHADGEIKHIGLLDVNISGGSAVGALVGFNNGKITNSYARLGTVTATGNGASPVGGLVGFNERNSNIISSFANVSVMGTHDRVGGLAGDNRGSIINSHALGSVEGSNNIGGLVGHQDGGSIINSYAMGRVTGKQDSGGLVGENRGSITNSYATGQITATGDNSGSLVGENRGSITNSYATGQITTAGDHSGGLVGVGNSNVTDSYWDRETSGQPTSAGGIAKTTAELQTPTAPGMTTANVYYNWSRSDWDFGDSSHYPALRHASGSGSLNACNEDLRSLSETPPCKLPLANQSNRNQGLAAVFFLADGSDITEELIPTFFPLKSSYNTVIATTASTVELIIRPYAINANATITVTDQNDNSYFDEQPNATLSDPIMLSDPITLTLTVRDTTAEGTVDTVYTFAIKRVLPVEISGLMINPHPVDEGGTARITSEVSGGSGSYQYAYLLDNQPLPSPSQSPFEFTLATDIVAAAVTTQTVKLTIRVSDDDGQTFEHSEDLTIRKVDNGVADIDVTQETSRTLAVTMGSDPDGNAADPDYSYQWQVSEVGSQWANIMSATNSSYTITDALAVVGNEFRVQVTYSDGQGYRKTFTSSAIEYIPPSQGLKIRTKVFLEGPLR